MRPTPIRKSEAFTLIEALFVLVGLAVLAALLLPSFATSKAQSHRIICVSNLKQISAAYRAWENDNGDCYPALQSVTKGGWREILKNADQGSLCWTNYVILANEKSLSPKVDPKVLLCPSDGRISADSFTNFANTNLSYFVGVSSCDTDPQSLLGGDRNLGPGDKPGRNYGFSPASGKGNDVAIPTHSKDGPVCWTLKIHSAGNTAGAGNIMLGDGSVQQCTSAGFRKTCLVNANPTTNWPAGHIPSSPSIRVLFP